jgi:hypothetical protein
MWFAISSQLGDREKVNKVKEVDYLKRFISFM